MTEYDRAGLKAPLERRPGCKELSCYMAVNLIRKAGKSAGFAEISGSLFLLIQIL